MLDMSTRTTLDRSALEVLLADRDPAVMLDLTLYDLSNGDFSGLNLSNLRIGSMYAEVRTIRNANFNGACLRDVDFANIVLEQCCFRHAECTGASFVNARFHKVAFRDACLTQCDFRYAEFNETSFAGATLSECDLYRVVFRRTVVWERAHLVHCSLHSADLSGCDMNWRNLEGNAIVQTDPSAYHKFLHLTAARINDLTERKNFASKIDQYVSIGPIEAAGTYRKVSALLGAKGLYHDSAEAYVAARRMERRSMSPRGARRIALAEAVIENKLPPSVSALGWTIVRSFPTYLELLVADALCRFGTSVGQVLLSMVVTILSFTVLYSITGSVAVQSGGSVHPATIIQCFAFSLGKMLASVPDGFYIHDGAIIFGQIETFISIGLIGLFGFVLGNYFRQS